MVRLFLTNPPATHLWRLRARGRGRGL